MTAETLRYLWQQPDWPHLDFHAATAGPAPTRVWRLQSHAMGMARAIGIEAQDAIAQALWMQEAVATSAIEGEALDLAAVRSSVLRHLGKDDPGPQVRHVDGLVEVLQDALQNVDVPLDADRLCRWQSTLFPGGADGLRRIAVGRFRDHADPMRIVSGRLGKEVVHYTALPSARVGQEMEAFLNGRQRKLLQRLLSAGDGGFLGGLNVEKYLTMVDASKATAPRDLSDLVRRGLLHTSGQGKALRHHVSVPGWTHGHDPASDATPSSPDDDDGTSR